MKRKTTMMEMPMTKTLMKKMITMKTKMMIKRKITSKFIMKMSLLEFNRK